MTAASRVQVGALALIAIGCVVMAAPDLGSLADNSSLEHFVVGYAVGTLFGQTTVAAFWTVLGSPPLYRRLLTALGWLALLVSALVIGFRLEEGLLRELPMVGISLGAQWILVQIPLWLLRYGARLRLHAGDPLDASMPQFGLSQLMSFTFGIAVLLGVLRWVVLSQVVSFASPGMTVWLFLAGAAVLMSLPLGLAALMPRFAAWFGVLILLLIGLATAWEHPLLVQVSSGGRPEVMDLVWINVFTSAWVLAFAVMARWNGYRLRKP